MYIYDKNDEIYLYSSICAHSISFFFKYNTHTHNTHAKEEFNIINFKKKCVLKRIKNLKNQFVIKKIEFRYILKRRCFIDRLSLLFLPVAFFFLLLLFIIYLNIYRIVRCV